MEQQKCKQFIESLVSFFEWDQRANEWEIKTNLKLKIMVMSIKKNGAFIKDEIEFIYDTINEFELTKFELREFGWCSAYKLTHSCAGFLEFSWIRQKDYFLSDECTCVTCKSRFDF